MLKTTILPNKPALSRNHSNRSASNRNNNNWSASKKNEGNNKVNRFNNGRNDIEHAKKLRKLSKSGKSKSEKTFIFWTLAKSGKNLSKSGNSTNFNAIKAGQKFLTLDTRISFNCLWLAFTKALILSHFDLECHIGIKNNALSYAISWVLR